MINTRAPDGANKNIISAKKTVIRSEEANVTIIANTISISKTTVIVLANKNFQYCKKNISIEMTTVITCAKIHCASLQIQLLSVLQRQLFSRIAKTTVTCSAKMNVIYQYSNHNCYQ